MKRLFHTLMGRWFGLYPAETNVLDLRKLDAKVVLITNIRGVQKALTLYTDDVRIQNTTNLTHKQPMGVAFANQVQEMRQTFEVRIELMGDGEI